ncbi:hypothetical protein LB562_13515 [Mesorhizobium sp. B263B1A]|uniref:hypothetical protein n=2 Tax=Mesorhizobium TaxID=68287 RepID=UPI001CD06C3C|nr:hypothetical protein [Mesorhizobium sp. B263B1A]MCA0025501.1 hypothetical protein [Mesorhizobium sp. B263B1A]
MMRTVLDMIAGRDAPQPAGKPGIGRILADLDSHQCRFPLQGDGAATRFCAAGVSEADWLPGFPGRCYCTFHRSLSVGRGTEAERAAPRVLERLAG